MKSILKKAGLPVLVIFGLLLSACQSLYGVTAPTITPRVTNVLPTATVAKVSEGFATKTPAPVVTAEPTIAFTPSDPATCEAASVLPVVSEAVDEKIPDSTPQDHFFGSDDALVTIIEYTDYQCKICANLAINLRDLQTQYPDDVKVILRYLLSKENDKAFLAAQAAEAAGLQDMYWEMHDLLFTSQEDWTLLSDTEFSDWLVKQAKVLKMDTKKFEDDLTSDAIVQKVFDANKESDATTLPMTPSLFFNKSSYQNWIDLSSLVNMVEYYKLSERTYTACPEMTIDPEKQYTVTFETEKGDIVFELYPRFAPVAVNSFVFLAREGWYDNSPFYRVIPDYIVQGGDPSGSSNGKPGYHFTLETTPRLRFNQAGMLALATDSEGYNGSQFFITYSAIPEYDGKFTIFGKVIEGMEVLESLRPRDPYYDQVLLPADILTKVTIEEN